MPDQGIAPWVSANDKPMATAGSKPVTGDAAERRLKGDVMQLPARDRRRIKDLVHNDVRLHIDLSLNVCLSRLQYDPHENLSNLFAETHRRPSATTDVPASAAGGINKMSK